MDFLTDRQWTPLFADAHYGILSLVSGTLVTTAVALLVAVPMGSLIAIYLSEYASRPVREFVKPVLELLSAVPTVVYGYFALLFVTPALQQIWPDLPGFNMLSDADGEERVRFVCAGGHVPGGPSPLGSGLPLRQRSAFQEGGARAAGRARFLTARAAA